MIFEVVICFNVFLTIVFVLGVISMKRFKLKNFCPKVSIVIAVWNEEKTIENSIQGVLRQDYGNEYEIIIAGGGSDKTPEICRALEKKYKQIRYIYEKTSNGKFEALNIAIKQAKNDIIVVLDADTQLGKDWLRILVAPLENSKVDFSYGMQLPEKNMRHNTMMVYLVQLFYLGLNQIKWHCWGNGANMAFRKKVWEKLGGFKNVLLEDILFNYEASDAGFNGVFSPLSYVLARFPEDITQQYKRNSRFFRGTLELMKEHKIKAIPLSLIMLLPVSVFTGFFSWRIMLANIAFFSAWYIVINAADKKLKITIKEALQTVFQMVLLITFAVPYTLEWFNPKKKKEWTRV